MHLVSETRPQVKRDRLLRMPEVEAVTGLKKSSLYSLQRRGAFPNPVRISARCTAWPESAVLQWVQARIAESEAASASQRVQRSLLPGAEVSPVGGTV